jgi:plastocyanin
MATQAMPAVTDTSMPAATDAMVTNTQPAATNATATTAPASGSGIQVDIANFAFSPATLTVKVGTTVTWTNQDSAAHTVTSDTGLFDSGNMPQGKTFSYTFTTAGTYAYHCTYHAMMKATVVVTQ